jgi:hypothetical protein
MTKKEIIERGMRLLKRHVQVVNKGNVGDFWRREDFEDGFEEGLQEYIRDSGYIFKTTNISATVYNGFYFYLPNDISKGLQVYCNRRLLVVKTPQQISREYGSNWRTSVGTPIAVVLDYPFEVEGGDISMFYAENVGNRIPARLFPRPPTYQEQGHVEFNDDDRARFIVDYLKYELGIVDTGVTYGEANLTFSDIVDTLSAIPVFFTNSNVEITAEYTPIHYVVSDDDAPGIPEPAHMGLAYYCAYYVASMSPEEKERALAGEFYARYKRTLTTYNSESMLNVKRKVKRNIAFRGI